MNAFVPSGIFKRQHHATSVRTPFARMLPRVMGGLSNKIVGSQHHGSVGLGLLLEELTTSVQVGSALITMVLHHADDPAAILRNVAQCVPHGGPVVIGEFHPEGPCSSGPPREHRLAVEKVRRWCDEAGLAVAGYRRQTPEHYMLVAQRGTPCA